MYHRCVCGVGWGGGVCRWGVNGSLHWTFIEPREHNVISCMLCGTLDLAWLRWAPPPPGPQPHTSTGTR